MGDEQEQRERDLIHELAAIQNHADMLRRVCHDVQCEIATHLHNDEMVRQKMLQQKH